MKFFFISLFFFMSILHGIQAQIPPSGDIISPGSNSWVLHTPDDGRKELSIVPFNNEFKDWDWTKGFIFYNNGDFRVQGKARVRYLYLSQKEVR